MQRYTIYFIWKLLYMFWVVPSPIIRSANNCIYSIWYLSHRYCYLPRHSGRVVAGRCRVQQLHGQQPSTYAQPEAANADLGS
jgi:hypothetical protein